MRGIKSYWFSHFFIIHTDLVTRKIFSFARETGPSKWKQVELQLQKEAPPKIMQRKGTVNVYVNVCGGSERRCWWASKRLIKWHLPLRIHRGSGARVWAIASQAQNPDQQEMSVKGSSLWRSKDMGPAYFQLFGFSFLASWLTIPLFPHSLSSTLEITIGF